MTERRASTEHPSSPSNLSRDSSEKENMTVRNYSPSSSKESHSSVAHSPSKENIKDSVVNHQSGHRHSHSPPPPSAPAKSSNFSISSILSRPDTDFKKKEDDREKERDRDRERIKVGDLHDSLRIDTHMAAAAMHFHHSMSSAFLQRQLPGKPTPWYPWFAASPYGIHFPFDSKYNIFITYKTSNIKVSVYRN